MTLLQIFTVSLQARPLKTAVLRYAQIFTSTDLLTKSFSTLIDEYLQLIICYSTENLTVSANGVNTASQRRGMGIKTRRVWCLGDAPGGPGIFSRIFVKFTVNYCKNINFSVKPHADKQTLTEKRQTPGYTRMIHVTFDHRNNIPKFP